MVGPRRGAFVTALLWLSLIGTSGAQEFRIHTRVYDLNSEDGSSRTSEDPEMVGESLTLSHAGKMYDYMPAIGEVIIFEPAHRRFIVLNTLGTRATTVDFDQLNHLLELARREARSSLEVPPERGGPPDAVAEALRFQLEPDFTERFDGDRRRLVLSSPHLRYVADGAKVDPPEAAELYLDYADWICKLNYVLNPQALLPDCRLALNASLRRKGLMPTRVELETEFDPQRHLRAEHVINWDLGENEHAVISRWERMLRSEHTRQVTFREYQQAMIEKQAKRE